MLYKNNPILLRTIYDIVDNVLNDIYPEQKFGCLQITGPYLINKYFSQKYISNLNLEFLGDGIYHNYLNEHRKILKIYEQYRQEQKQFSNEKHYTELFVEKNIYDHKILINNYISDHFPNIIHIIDLNSNKKLKYNFMKTFENQYTIHYWDLEKIKSFILTFYPFYNHLFNQSPNTILHFSKMLISYHFGGLYINYYVQKQKNIQKLFINNKKNYIKLFYKKSDNNDIQILNNILLSLEKSQFLKDLLDNMWNNIQNNLLQFNNIFKKNYEKYKNKFSFDLLDNSNNFFL